MSCCFCLSCYHTVPQAFSFFFFLAIKYFNKLEDHTHSFRSRTTSRIIMPDVLVFWRAVQYALASRTQPRPSYTHSLKNAKICFLSVLQGDTGEQFDVV